MFVQCGVKKLTRMVYGCGSIVRAVFSCYLPCAILSPIRTGCPLFMTGRELAGCSCADPTFFNFVRNHSRGANIDMIWVSYVITPRRSCSVCHACIGCARGGCTLALLEVWGDVESWERGIPTVGLGCAMFVFFGQKLVYN